MTLYRPSRRKSLTWHIVASEIEEVGICGTAVKQEARPPYRNYGELLCPKCYRILNPPVPVFNEGEELLAIHLAELGVPFERQYKYAPDRDLRADFAILPWYYRDGGDNEHEHPGILIEVNGGLRTPVGGHSGFAGITRDIDRLNAATLNGWFLLRFVPREVASGAAKGFIQKVLKEQSK